MILPAYGASCWGLVEYAQLTGYAPLVLGILPALVLARFWKGLLTFGLIGFSVWFLARTSA
jgi:hypothetical protein